MRILVTGSEGFIGKAFCAEMGAHGHDIVPFDSERGEFVEVDFDYTLDSVDKDESVDLVVHLAAEVGKLNCEQLPLQAINTNVYGMLCVARACGRRHIPLAYVSTSEVYGDYAHHEVFENFQPRPSSGMYGLTKLWGEHIAQSYAPEGLRIIRPTMPYGPGVPPGPGRRALDNLVWQALTDQDMVVHSGASRSWCWISDVARGMRYVIERGGPGIYNVGRDDDEVSMRKLAQRICLLTKRPESLIKLVDPPVMQTPVKRLSCAKLGALGWTPLVSLDEGLPMMVAWVSDYLTSDSGTLRRFL